VVDEYDDDYAYFWSRGDLEIPIPRWLAEIMDVPFGVRMEILCIGICTGLILAAVTLLAGFLVAVG
jgi:hypothetical protein